MCNHPESAGGTDNRFSEKTRSAELFLRVVTEAEAESEVVEYYFVDFVARVVFWITEVNVLNLGLTSLTSEAALREFSASGFDDED